MNLRVTVGSWRLKSLAGVTLMALGAVGIHSSGVEAIRHSHDVVESVACRGSRDDDRGDDDRGDDDRGHDREGHGRRGQSSGLGLRQIISVRIPATAFLRVDKSGRVTAAATNTGCRPGKNDDVFLFRSDGTIVPTTGRIACDWSGDFTVPGRFQPQDCRIDRHRRGNKESAGRPDD